MLVIGRNPVIETIKFSPDTINKIILLDSVSDSKIKFIELESKTHNIKIERLSKKEFEKILSVKDKSDGISQGVIAEVKEFEYSNTSEILKAVSEKPCSAIIILDEIQDPHNFGAIVRTAVCTDVDGIIISEKNSVKVNHTVIKTSSGATNFIKISKEQNIYKTIGLLKASGFIVIGTSLNTKLNLYQTKFDNKITIIFGNEEKGIRKNILKLCDIVVNIPIGKKINSLNVSVSAGVILYELFRQRNYSNK